MQKHKFLNIFRKTGSRIGLAAGVVLAFVMGYLLRPASTEPTPSEAVHAEHAAAPASESKQQWWTCSMHPQIKMPKKGLCPICNMDLIPMEDHGAEDGGSLRTLSVSENARQLMNVQTAPVERKFVETTVRMVGKVGFDETRLAAISAWVPGRLDRLFVDYTGVTVSKGDHMVSLYSPDLYSAQEELLQAHKAAASTSRSESSLIRGVTQSTIEAARDKLRLWGLSDEQIAEVEKSGKASDHTTINAPIGGVVIHKDALEGQYVQTGTKIYTIADLSQVWVYLDAYESDLQWLRYGQPVEFTTVSYPGETFQGTVAFIDPVLNDQTRTVRVRVNVSNPEGKLKPKMFVKAAVRAQIASGGRVMNNQLAGKWISPMHPEIVKDQPGTCDVCGMPLVPAESLGYASSDSAELERPLVIPASAPLITGTRAIVYVRLPDTEKPTYEGREIVLGPRAGDYYLVRSGLAEGDQVVVQGNFKIDSSLQIQAKPSMMSPEGAGSAGHDHGGGTAKPDAQEAPVGMELPVLFKKQLQIVISAAQNVSKAMEAKEIASVQQAYAGLDRALQNVDMSLLTGHPHMLWMEYEMRLSNDAAEGAQVKTMDDARRIYTSLTGNISALKNQFGITHAAQEQKQSDVSAEFQKQLQAVVQSYFGIGRSLAGDQLTAASEAYKRTLEAFERVDAGELSEEQLAEWKKLADALKAALVKGSAAPDIDQSRQSFHQLSQALTEAIERFGFAGTDSVYVLYCPMAFDNTGARWLQDSKDVLNPYFGEMMLTCGSVEDMISATQTDGK